MREITVYRANDGREFYCKAECEKYEADGCVEFKPLPKYGDLKQLTERALNWMLNGDGDCHYATATTYAPCEPVHPTKHPAWATHLVYFGK